MSHAALARRRRLWAPEDDLEASAWLGDMLAETIHTEISQALARVVREAKGQGLAD